MNYIFDFDGTIADSFEYVLGFLSQEAGRKMPKEIDSEDFRKISMKDMAFKLGIPFWRLPFIYFKGRRVMRAHMEHVNAFKDLPGVIKRLHEEGHQLFIISSNSVKNIRHFLKRYEIDHCFKAVWGGAGLLGKINLIKQLRRRYKIKGDTCYVGDETGDIASAKMAGVKAVAVTWGFAGLEDIERFEPDMIISKPNQLLEV